MAMKHSPIWLNSSMSVLTSPSHGRINEKLNRLQILSIVKTLTYREWLP